MLQGILYEEDSVFLFLLVTVAMGGWAAWMTARAVALGWRPAWQIVPPLLLLAGAVRFIHFALFQGTLLSARYYAADALVVLLVGALAFRVTRVQQMTGQYPWLYERRGPLAWRAKGPEAT
ncbi:DUF6867 family protein [Methylobacterium organophilum]|uniref:DUF6867 domain-containing protein n=1 Tax=Methylobacterium organophilum TaxID=410 RepID=A0ABQ4TGL0_METOR|nr:hypothetical protein [Methylobacterium organophilum]GJE29182.1 hypothetical protein LKMONMHP_4061 [Methylobacterium organophilum]